MRKFIIYGLVLLLISFTVKESTSIAENIPEHGKVMLVSLKMENNKHNIKKITIQPGQHPRIRRFMKEGQDNNPQLMVIDQQNNILYKTAFNYPNVQTVPPLPPGRPGDKTPSVIPIEEPEATLIVPYFTQADLVLIINPGESTPSAIGFVQDAEFMTNKEDYTAFELQPSEPGKFHILIMASNYNANEMNKFRTQAHKIKKIVLETTPFKKYAKRIKVHIYENQKDLGCFTGCYNIDRLTCCNQSKVMSAAAKSGFNVDEIIIVHNTDTYSGGGYRENPDTYKNNSNSSYCVVYDGYYSPVMALHEFGHSFGNLCDEYSYGSEGYTYYNCVNCRKDCNDYPQSSKCQPGCDAKPNYYRPDNSVMYSLSYSFYNKASINAPYPPDGLKKRLQYFISK